jgi:hypothetical protein
MGDFSQSSVAREPKCTAGGQVGEEMAKYTPS